MSTATIEIITIAGLTAMGLYLLAGLFFYIPFIRKGLRQIDEGSIEAPRMFRILILPGTLAFWPLLWKKWRQAKKAAKK